MNDYVEFKRKVQHRVEILEEAIEGLNRLGLTDKGTASRWKAQLAQVEASFHDPLLRVAVVGSVKSGKSTLINTLVGKDLLRRGAGILTAFVTRIQTNGEVGGWVELKPWSQIHNELNSTLRLLPIVQEESSEHSPLDLRKPQDRDQLKHWLERVQAESQKTRGHLDHSFLLLNGYLEGYTDLQGSMGDTVNRLIFDQHSIGHHQRYAGGQAAYVRDLELHCPVEWLGEKIEIADCQGSDSPNPAHMELLQQYLLGSHFILYVIGSRTGLREADFRLIEFIKTLRMFPQTFFVLNVDLDVHPHREDLEQLVERVHKELSWVIPNPQLYAFSALYHLTDRLKASLPDRDRRRFDLWREDEAMARYTEEGFAAFRNHLSQRIGNERVRVLFGSGLSRLSMVAGNVRDTAEAQRQLMDTLAGNYKKAAGRLKNKQKMLKATLATLDNAIAGFKDTLKHELDKTVDRHFHLVDGLIVKETMKVVDCYPIDSQVEKNLTDYRQFVRQLYEFYLGFRQSLSRHLVERANVMVVELAKEQEALLQERLSQSSQAFWALFENALETYRREMAQLEIDLHTAVDMHRLEWPSLHDIVPPTFSAFVDQEALGRGVLLMKFGLGRLTRFLTGLKSRIGKHGDFLVWSSQESETIEEAIGLVKLEAKSELAHAFKEYRNSFRRAYLYRLLEEGTRRLLEEFRTRAAMAQIDFANLLKKSEMQGEERQRVVEALTRTSRIAEAMIDELNDLRCAVTLGWPVHGEAASPAAQEPLLSAELR